MVKGSLDGKKHVAKLVKTTRAWCAEPRNDRRAPLETELKKILAGAHPRAAAMAAVQLFAMSVWYGRQGTLSILDGRPEGWADLDRALHYTSWNARLNPKTTLASTVAALLANAVLFDHDELAEALAARLTADLDEQALLGWALSPFAAFMVKLWGIGRGADVDVSRPKVAPLGVYQGVVDAFHDEAGRDEAALGPALAAACDYHLDQTQERHAHAEFLQVPYPLFPADILVIGAVRAKLGLPTPRPPHPPHPLLATPLAAVPPRAERPGMGEDPLLEKVVARAKATGLA